MTTTSAGAASRQAGSPLGLLDRPHPLPLQRGPLSRRHPGGRRRRGAPREGQEGSQEEARKAGRHQQLRQRDREDGSVEVQLGHTHAMGYVTSQLVQPYRDRPNEGTLAIFTEFPPMADPSFEPGSPGEFAIELGRIIDRGLREIKAMDLESLCVVPGKSVWVLLLDLHILDNGGNLIDVANIAALASLSTFQRPECSVGGENGQEVIAYEPEARDPIPLTIFHLLVAVTFAFLGEDNVVVDPTYKEEVVIGGRLTATMNSNTDVCAIQRAGGEGVSSDVIMQCLCLASVHAVNITSKIKNAEKKKQEDT